MRTVGWAAIGAGPHGAPRPSPRKSDPETGLAWLDAGYSGIREASGASAPGAARVVGSKLSGYVACRQSRAGDWCRERHGTRVRAWIPQIGRAGYRDRSGVGADRCVE